MSTKSSETATFQNGDQSEMTSDDLTDEALKKVNNEILEMATSLPHGCPSFTTIAEPTPSEEYEF
jgi:hypothetical protein